jgi:hypothetical protein
MLPVQSDGSVRLAALSSTPGSADIIATATDPLSGASLETSIPFVFVGPPANATVTAPSPIPDTGASPINIIITDSQSTPLENVGVGLTLTAGVGSLSTLSTTTDENGEVTSIFTPDIATGAQSVSVQVTVPPLMPQTVSITVYVPT